jgi:hypothetical protein
LLLLLLLLLLANRTDEWRLTIWLPFNNTVFVRTVPYSKPSNQLIS